MAFPQVHLNTLPSHSYPSSSLTAFSASRLLMKATNPFKLDMLCRLMAVIAAPGPPSGPVRGHMILSEPMEPYRAKK
jgi:hypothetical protein